MSTKIEALISGEKTYIIGIADGWWMTSADGQYIKQPFQQRDSIQFQDGNKTLIVFNSTFFDNHDIDQAINFISDILQDGTLKTTIKEELNKNNVPESSSSGTSSVQNGQQNQTISSNNSGGQSNASDSQNQVSGTDNSKGSPDTHDQQDKTPEDSKISSGISSSSVLDDFMASFDNAKKRLNEKLKNSNSSNTVNPNATVSPNGIIIGATKVYGGPGSIAYAQIGSLSTGDTYDVIFNEFGWQYVLYSTASGYKAGYISGGTDNVYPSAYATGVEGKMNSQQTVYAGPSNSGYATIGTVSANENVAVLVVNYSYGYHYIEYSSSSGTKRGYVAASSVTINSNSALAKMSSNSSTYTGPAKYFDTAGVINLEEYVTIIEKNSSFAFVEYNTKSGRKRAYLPLPTLQILNASTTIPGISVTTNYVDATMSSASDIYGGPSADNYSKIGSVDINEAVGVINVENGWLYIQYYTSNGPKRGYVLTSQVNNGSYISSTVPNKTRSYNGQNNSANKNATIYAGPGIAYATIGTVYQYEGLTQFTSQENSFTFIEYSTSSGTKRGFIQNADLSGRTEGGLATVSQDKLATYYGPDFSDGLNLSLGSVWIDEYVTILQKNDTKSYIEYNTLSGRKRGYASNSGLTFFNTTNVPTLPSYTETLYNSLQSTNVYSGPDDNYASVGSIGVNETVTVYNTDVYGYSYIRYSTTSGFKRGYVPKNFLELFVYNVSVPEINLTNVTKGVYGTSGQGRELAYYQIGQGNNHMILNFCIHGFEDHWAHDGYELVLTAQQLLNQLNDSLDIINSKNWTVYVILSSNPDGLIDGTTENGPGRCSTRMLNDDGSVSSDHGIDINRSFPQYFMQYTTARNYTGPHSLMSKESVALKKFIEDNKSPSGNNVLIDAHGWLHEIISANQTGSIYQELLSQFPGSGYEYVMNTDKHGFVSTWATSIGYDGALFEFPADVWSHADMINKRYQQSYINAIMNIISNYHAQ